MPHGSGSGLFIDSRWRDASGQISRGMPKIRKMG